MRINKVLKTAALIGIFLAFILSPLQNVRAAGDYGYYIVLSIDADNIGSNLYNFPVYLDIDKSELATTANGGHIQNTVATGGINNDQTIPADFDLCEDETCAVTYDYEWIFYNPVSGRSQLYVKVPIIDDTVDTDIYVVYGDSGTTLDNENIAGVWTNDYAAVWHFEEASGTRYDSAGDNDLTDNNTVTYTSGVMDDAALFTAANSEYLSIADNADISLDGGDYFISVWLNHATNAAQDIIVKWDTGTNSREYRYLISGGYWFVQLDNNGTTPVTTITNYDTPVTGQWSYLSNILYSSNHYTYEENSLILSGAAPAAIYDGTATLTIGGDSNFYNGGMDELRISKTARGTDWRAAQYLTQSDPATFFTTGTEQSIGPEATNTPTASNTPTATATNTPTATATATPDLTATAAALSDAQLTATAEYAPTATFITELTQTAQASITPSATSVPADTATPGADFDVVPIDGRDLVVDHHVTIGDIGITIALLVIITILSIQFIVELVAKYLK